MTREMDEDFFKGEPESVLGLIKIKGGDYALVQWTTDKKFYVPYVFMKKNYPLLLLEFYSSKVNFKLIAPKKKLTDIIKENDLG